MNFNQVRYFLNEDIMSEGGHAVKDVTPIPQKNIPATLKSLQTEVLDKIKLTEKGTDWDLIGSALKKKEDSGDLDLIINVNEIIRKNKEVITVDDVLPFIESKLKGISPDFKISAGLGVASFSFPIDGLETRVQVDLMLTDNMDFTRWAYWSPDETESKYKKTGLARNILLSNIITSSQEKVLKTFESGENEEVERLYLQVSAGLGKKIISYKGKDNKPVKNPKTLSSEIITKVPEEIIEIALGKGATRKDSLSFETLFARMNHKNFPAKSEIPTIKRKTKETLIKLGVPVFSELDD